MQSLELPLLGAMEVNENSLKDELLIPLIDGNLIKFDKEEGSLEVNSFKSFKIHIENSIQYERLEYALFLPVINSVKSSHYIIN